MNWYVVDKKYINYLTQFDSHVGYVEYGERLKLHVGILLTVGDFHYYVPISSAKPKHQKMSNSLDFHKLQDESTRYLPQPMSATARRIGAKPGARASAKSPASVKHIPAASE